MESRVKSLETAMSQVQQDMAVLRANYATREDLHREVHALTWKILLAFGLIGSAISTVTFFIARYAL
jgi:uncharacterized protein (DUF3084 family)